jgi:hypothetical protein
MVVQPIPTMNKALGGRSKKRTATKTPLLRFLYLKIKKNRQVGEKWVYDDCSYLCKGLY